MALSHPRPHTVVRQRLQSSDFGANFNGRPPQAPSFLPLPPVTEIFRIPASIRRTESVVFALSKVRVPLHIQARRAQHSLFRRLDRSCLVIERKIAVLYARLMPIIKRRLIELAAAVREGYELGR